MHWPKTCEFFCDPVIQDLKAQNISIFLHQKAQASHKRLSKLSECISSSLKMQYTNKLEWPQVKAEITMNNNTDKNKW
jgi:hypothetical protein